MSEWKPLKKKTIPSIFIKSLFVKRCCIYNCHSENKVVSSAVLYHYISSSFFPIALSLPLSVCLPGRLSVRLSSLPVCFPRYSLSPGPCSTPILYTDTHVPYNFHRRLYTNSRVHVKLCGCAMPWRRSENVLRKYGTQCTKRHHSSSIIITRWVSVSVW